MEAEIAVPAVVAASLFSGRALDTGQLSKAQRHAKPATLLNLGVGGEAASSRGSGEGDPRPSTCLSHPPSHPPPLTLPTLFPSGLKTRRGARKAARQEFPCAPRAHPVAKSQSPPAS